VAAVGPTGQDTSHQKVGTIYAQQLERATKGIAAMTIWVSGLLLISSRERGESPAQSIAGFTFILLGIPVFYFWKRRQV